MSVFLLPLIILATLLVVLSGLWVMIALIDAVWHVKHPESASLPEPEDAADKSVS